MKGLALSQAYFQQVGRAKLEETFPVLFPRMAIGLAGEGSECFGFDDQISQDHDWGAAFCIWLSQEDYHRYGQAVEKVYRNLPTLGFPQRKEEELAHGRVGCLCTPDWYAQFTGQPQGPQTLTQWRRVPEHFLATATNGQVFHDPSGAFTQVRKHLLGYYPEDVRIKKMVARMVVMAQAGQYNYPRCLQRGEFVAAQLALAEFTKAAMSMAYLLHKRYAPYYKWMHHGLTGMTQLPKLQGQLQRLSQSTNGAMNQRTVEEICTSMVQAVQMQGLSQNTSAFLADHAPEMMGHIEDVTIGQLHIMEE